MRYVFSLLSILAFTVLNAFAQDTIPANNANIEYTGRIDFSNPLAPRFSYSGISIRANFNGTSISAILDDDIGENYYNIILDNKLHAIINVTSGKKAYLLASGLVDTEHEIEIFKRTELEFGKTQFFGFILDEGKTLSAITNTRELLIEFIGNSITCGYGNEGVLGQTFGPTTENHYLTYAAITSRNFMARHMAVSRSGIGVYRNYGDPTSGSKDCMSNNYNRTFFYDEEPKYSFTDQPDLVCINLGTNDFSSNNGDSALYVDNYLWLIDTIQTKYNQPEIICLLGPMLSGGTLTKVRQYLQVIADSANSKGKGNVTFFEMSTQTGSLGIDYHPTVIQHQKNAQELTAYIKSLMGWKIKPELIAANAISARQIQIEFNVPIMNSLDNYSGLSVSNKSGYLTISAILTDTSDQHLVNIYLKDRLLPNDTLTLNYLPGTIETVDSIKILAFSDYPIVNTLTETKVNQSFIDSEGKTATFNFNKKLKENTSVDKITIYNKAGVIETDSAIFLSNIIVMYISENIVKGDSVFASYNDTSISGTDDILLASFTDLYIKNSSRVSTLSSQETNSIKLYPNPNQSGVVFYNIDDLKNARFVVFNTNGDVIFKGDLLTNKGHIDLTGKITNGVYFIKITSTTKEFTQPIIFSRIS